MIEEAMEKPGFWILGVVGTACVLIGWIASKKMELMTMPIWQVLIMIIVVWGASIVFASRD